ncbi:DUF4307 domain-containing protein [Streptomyces sp. JB150]|uniref:DUF4307 domain-containing protein n=1 Tax=Streptomyces sp. JB150 TaxID=2714844 RepID=UPI001F0DD06C|nr:DUF4307 domain-containing protein [Streptomyces sp. JB150]
MAADARKDRTLKITGALLGTALFALITYAGTTYVTGRQAADGTLIAFETLSDRTVQARLEVRKSRETVAVCTVRTLSARGAEVGRRDIRFTEPRDHVNTFVTVRTTQRAVGLELVGCRSATGP